MVKFTHFISKVGKNNNVLRKVFKRSPFPVMLQTFLTRRALKGHLGTQRSLGHSRHSGTWALKVLRHLRSSKGTSALGHLGTRGTLFSRLAKTPLSDFIESELI